MSSYQVRQKSPTKSSPARWTMTRLAVVGLLMLGAAGCENDDAAATGTATANTGGDSDEWWAVDAGTSADKDGGAGDDATSGNIDQTCYDGCIKKGQSKEVCTDACGDKKGGAVDQTCYDGCIKKGQSKEVCTDACGDKKGGAVDQTCYDGCIKKGQSKEVCTDACGDKKGGAVDQTCYDGCIKKGQSKEVCTDACGDKKGGNATNSCYESCTSKGGAAAFCKTGCGCYTKCVDDGGATKTCSGKCFQNTGGTTTYAQPCYDDCLKKGEKKEDCQKACPAKGGGTLTADWATVHAKVIKASCAGGYCHGGGSGSLKLTGDAAADYTALTTGKAGTKNAASCAAQAYVVAGKASESLLWLKVDAKATHGCGNKMPMSSTGLSAELSALVKDWITAGAKQK